MSLAPKRPCHTPGCPGTTRDGKWCERCKGKRHRGTIDDTAARKADKLFYKSTRWRQLRERKLAYEPLCEECHQQGRIESASEVDHIVPRSAGGRDHTDNLQALCETCHARKTVLHDGGFGRARRPMQTSSES